jgi:hypothetical protein
MSEPVRIDQALPGVLAEVETGPATAMTGGPSRSLRPAPAPIRCGCAAGSSTQTPRRVRSAPCTRPSGRRIPPGLKPSTRHTYRQLLDYQILPTFEKATLAGVDMLLVREWLAALVEAGPSPSRIRNAHQVLFGLGAWTRSVEPVRWSSRQPRSTTSWCGRDHDLRAAHGATASVPV